MLPFLATFPRSALHFLPHQNPLQALYQARVPSSKSDGFRCNDERHSHRTVTFCPIRSSLSGDVSTSAPILIEDIVERDWSFLDLDPINSEEERRDKFQRIISAGGVLEGSRVLVCLGSGWFVDRLLESVLTFDLLLVIHESLYALAMTKEKHDSVRCWQGEITALPRKFSQLDVVFVCYFPGLGLPLHQLLSTVASRCSPGGRLLISFEQGKQVIEGSHRQQYPDMVTYELPEKSDLEKAAPLHLFKVTEFVDEATFYLAVLTYIG